MHSDKPTTKWEGRTIKRPMYPLRRGSNPSRSLSLLLASCSLSPLLAPSLLSSDSSSETEKPAFEKTMVWEGAEDCGPRALARTTAGVC